MQGLFLLKNNFFIKLSIFVLVPGECPEDPLYVPDIMTFRGSSGDVPETACVGWVFPVIIFLIVMCITQK